MNSEIQPTINTPKTITLNVPLAIIIAGALIAAALYFKGGALPGEKSAGGKGNTAAQPEAQAPETVVGNFRPVDVKADHIRGPESAKVTVIEYSDLECPFCKRFHPTMQQLRTEYPKDVRWVYRHAPLEQLHSKAKKEAEAIECAGEQGKFWELTDKIFEVTPANDGLNLADLPKLAQEAGVTNIPQFQACLDSGKFAQHVQDDLADAEVAGMQGTPYSVIVAGDKKVPLEGAQPYASVKQVVDQLLTGV